jgi:UDPglucose 6-dehydrogenase
MKKNKIGIVGSSGMVGGALKGYFQTKPDYSLFLYDKFKNEGSMEEVNKADYIFICVPTLTTEKGECDTSIVKEVVSQIKGNKIIIIKSTVIPGTTDNLQDEFLQHKFLFNPEFLTEVTADQDMRYPDRQIIGYTKQSYTVAGDIMLIMPLAPFEKIMPAKEAEMVKYFTNSWFATKVIFANQMYDLCQKLRINYDLVKEGSVYDRRIGRSHLEIWHKGERGYGGKCLPKDTKAIIGFAEKLGVKLSLLKSVDEYNDQDLRPNK